MLRALGRPTKVGVKAGCFTLLHAGHVRALHWAADRCDYLIVLTNSDDRVAQKRGCVPISLSDRRYILASIDCVNETGWFSQHTEEQWVQKFKEERLHQEFGDDAELIVFHDPAVESSGYVPCQTIADDVVYIPYHPSKAEKTSVRDIFDLIKTRGVTT